MGDKKSIIYYGRKMVKKDTMTSEYLRDYRKFMISSDNYLEINNVNRYSNLKYIKKESIYKEYVPIIYDIIFKDDTSISVLYLLDITVGVISSTPFKNKELNTNKLYMVHNIEHNISSVPVKLDLANVHNNYWKNIENHMLFLSENTRSELGNKLDYDIESLITNSYKPNNRLPFIKNIYRIKLHCEANGTSEIMYKIMENITNINGDFKTSLNYKLLPEGVMESITQYNVTNVDHKLSFGMLIPNSINGVSISHVSVNKIFIDWSRVVMSPTMVNLYKENPTKNVRLYYIPKSVGYTDNTSNTAFIELAFTNNNVTYPVYNSNMVIQPMQKETEGKEPFVRSNEKIITSATNNTFVININI